MPILRFTMQTNQTNLVCLARCEEWQEYFYFVLIFTLFLCMHIVYCTISWSLLQRVPIVKVDFRPFCRFKMAAKINLRLCLPHNSKFLGQIHQFPKMPCLTTNLEGGGVFEINLSTPETVALPQQTWRILGGVERKPYRWPNPNSPDDGASREQKWPIWRQPVLPVSHVDVVLVQSSPPAGHSSKWVPLMPSMFIEEVRFAPEHSARCIHSMSRMVAWCIE